MFIIDKGELRQPEYPASTNSTLIDAISRGAATPVINSNIKPLLLLGLVLVLCFIPHDPSSVLIIYLLGIFSVIVFGNGSFNKREVD